MSHTEQEMEQDTRVKPLYCTCFLLQPWNAAVQLLCHWKLKLVQIKAATCPCCMSIAQFVSCSCCCCLRRLKTYIVCCAKCVTPKSPKQFKLLRHRHRETEDTSPWCHRQTPERFLLLVQKIRSVVNYIRILNLGSHWMRVCCGTAVLLVRSVLRCPSTPTGCVLERSTANSLSRQTTRFRMIKTSHVTTVSENLYLLTSGLVPTIMTFCQCSTVKYDPPSTLSFLILKINRMFNFVSVPDYPAPPQSARCWIAALRFVIRQKKKPCVSATEGSGSPEQWWSRNATQPQLLEAHTLTRIEMNQLHCRTGVQTQRTSIWQNSGVRHFVNEKPHKWTPLF